MLEIEDLPLDLRNYLDELEANANLMGGTIQSRQVIAIALVCFQDRVDLKEEIHKLKQDVLNITTILMKKEIWESKNSSSGGTSKSESDLHDNDWSYEDPDLGTYGTE